VFLVTRVNGVWEEVYALRPDHSVTIGRGSGNEIPVYDEKCSRRHCQLRYTTNGWSLSDLGSSNGTQVNGHKIKQDVLVGESDILRIGATELLFTSDPTHVTAQASIEIDAALDLPSDESVDEILERRRNTRFLTGSDQALSVPSSQQAGFRSLFRLVNQMLTAGTIRGLADTVIDGLAEACGSDIGAVLLFSEPSGGNVDPLALQLISYRAPEGVPYRKVSKQLSQEALKTGEAVLGLNVQTDPTLSEFRSLETLDARSVICAPIRSEGQVLGLIHLYSLESEASFTAEHLDFTLAVADEAALLVASLQQKQELSAQIDRISEEAQNLRKLLETETAMVGESQPIRQLQAEASQVAATGATVLIRGESGVGKELVARAIHFASPRRDKSFVCLNCAALTESLLESELFGHEKGAFTGATEQKAGKFEQADGGTLFLDEVGEMTAPTQAKFLRVLEGHSFERVGGQQSMSVDVRVVAATNRDLEQAVRDGEFRKDLYFRLQVLELTVPPLRERVDDIPVLANWFLQRCADRSGQPPKKLTRTAQLRLLQHRWPGNVRELRNVIERSAVMATGDEISERDLRFARRLDSDSAGIDTISESTLVSGAVSPDAPPATLEEIEKQHIQRTLIWTGWVKRESARLLGIERSTLDRKIQRYGLQRPD
jgi:Nif-specific regulatory protein